MKKCVKCNAELENDAEFCSECGEKQPVLKTSPTCPNCGNPVEEGAEFCPECGQKISGANPPVSDFSLNTGNDSFAERANDLKKKPAVLGGIGVAIVAIIAAVYFLFGGNTLQVKADDMINDYIRDQSTAEQKYKDKDIAITGRLLVKTQFKDSQNYNMIIASKTAGKIYSISLDVDSKNVKAVNSVNIGDFVSAKGKCMGIVPQENPTDINVQIHADTINE